MLYGLFISLFVIICLFLILIILIQQGKGGMGLGALGGGAQMLFGGSGGQDLFQKITWVLGSIFMLGSLFLAILKTYEGRTSHYFGPRTEQAPVPQRPVMPKTAQPVVPQPTPAAKPAVPAAPAAPAAQPVVPAASSETTQSEEEA